MLAEWNAECSADDPVLVVPWSDEESGFHFVDLRAEPYDIAEILEAELYPALGRALRSLNATRSPFLTAKCAVWSLRDEDNAEQMETLRLELDRPEAREGFGSYIDLVCRERALFASAHRMSERLDWLMRRAARLEHDEARLEFVLRPAVVDLGLTLEGFAATMYITAIAEDPETARDRWGAALEDVVALLRRGELEMKRGSATIEASQPAAPSRTAELAGE